MIKTICIIIILAANNIFSQNFFPMKMGNKYQIWEGYEGSPPEGGYYSGINYFKFSPLQDTIINDKSFFRFEYNESSSFPFKSDCFYGYDTLENILYVKLPGNDTLRTAVDFNIPKDSSFISYLNGSPVLFVSNGLAYTTNNEGNSVLSFGMHYYYFGPSLEYHFQSGIGLSSFNYSFHTSVYVTNDNIIAYKIDTLIFNPIKLSITSLSPLVNRPLNAFPFVIHGDYTANFNISDVFKLICKFQRDTTVYYTRTDIFDSQNNIGFQLPSGVLPGDILKLRAELTDNSIFNNSVSFPDTGYADILILAPVGINDKDIILSYKLEQNYPDPFNPSTTIKYGIKERTQVKLSVHDFLGREVKVLINEAKEPGNYQAQFDGSGLPSGIYIYTLSTKNFVRSNKMILLK